MAPRETGTEVKQPIQSMPIQGWRRSALRSASGAALGLAIVSSSAAIAQAASVEAAPRRAASAQAETADTAFEDLESSSMQTMAVPPIVTQEREDRPAYPGASMPSGAPESPQAKPEVEVLAGDQFGPVYRPDPQELTTKAPKLRWTDPPASVPPSLLNAIAIVTERDPAALASWWRVRAATAGVKSARWQRFPSLSVDTNVSSNSNWLLPSLTVDLPVWAGGRIDATMDRAEFQEASAEAGWEEVVLDLALLVSDTYFDIVLNTRLRTVYQESLAAHRDLVGTMQRRVNQKISAEADLQLAQSRAAQIEQELLIIETQRDTALQTLAELVRDPEYELGNAPVFRRMQLVQDWKGIAEEALVFSPTRQRLVQDANVAEQDIRLARSTLWPQISAQYAYNDVTGGRVGLGVRLQTGNGLSRFADIDNARARYQTATSQTRLFERQLRQQLAGEIALNLASLSRSDVSLQASISAAAVSASYLRQFIAGRRSWLDVMNTLRENLAAQSSLLQAETTAMATSVRLNLRSGRWRPERASGE